MLTINRKIRKLKRLAGRMDAEEGFTLVELSMVIIISVIMLAGMVAIITNAFDLFSSSKNIQAITDSSRRILGSMTRQIRTSLNLVDAECTIVEGQNYGSSITFYADVDDDQGTAADVDNYDAAEKVTFYLENGKVMMSLLEPAGGDPVPAVLGSHVNGMEFYYFMAGEKPQLDSVDPDPTRPTNSYTSAEKNESVGMVRIVLRMEKEGVRRTYYQDVFLRVLDR